MKVAESDLHCLLNKLVLVSLAAQRRWVESDSLAKLEDEQEERRLYRQVITDCLTVVGSVLGEHPSMMAALSKNPSVREFVVSTLARNPSSRIRRQMGQLLVGSMPIAGTLLRWLTAELEELPLSSRHCRDFFGTLGELVWSAPMETSDDGAEQQLDLRSLARVTSRKMVPIVRDGSMSCTGILLGCLEVVRDLIEIGGPEGTLLDGTELGQDLVGSMFNGFLFTMPEQRGAGGMSLKRPVCTELSTRRAAMNVMASAARKSPKAMSTLVDNVERFVGRMRRGTGGDDTRRVTTAEASSGSRVKSRRATCTLFYNSSSWCRGCEKKYYLLGYHAESWKTFRGSWSAGAYRSRRTRQRCRYCSRCRERFFTCGTESGAPSTPFA
ncbi:unnamed protein product [Ascophyllum nodosum]